MAKAEKNFLRQKRLESGRRLSEEDLDPKFASSRLPNREVGTNLRSQLFAYLTRETEKHIAKMILDDLIFKN